MKNYRIAFYVSEKARTKGWAEIIAQGARAHGDTVIQIKQSDYNGLSYYRGVLADCDGAANLGMGRMCRQLMDGYRAAGKFFLYFDKAYISRFTHWRVSVNEWQPLEYFQRFHRAGDRFARLGVEPQPRAKRRLDTHIVLAGSCQNYCNFMGLGNVNDYNEGIVKNLRQFTERKIVYRPNPSWAFKHADEFRPLPDTVLSKYNTPFKSVLDNCHLLVTHGTSAALGAMLAGVPSMVIGRGICKPVAMGPTWDLIEDPYWPKDTVFLQMLYDLAYCQWTPDEYRSGEAWADLRLVFSSLEGGVHADGNVLEQYKIMHRSERYFRGLTTLRYEKEIKWLVERTGATTLLDYGSGKGEQYTLHELAKSWNDIQVTCYDPAVPAFDKLPDGHFDGVICCDVLEHIPEPEVQPTLQRILGSAERFVFLGIAASPANKNLPDGRNCHLTLRPAEWWQEQVGLARKAIRKKKLRVKVVVKGDDGD